MGSSIWVRLTRALATVVILSGVVFALVRMMPGDPAAIMAGDYATPQEIARIRGILGLDQPLHIQYTGYMRRLAANEEYSIATRRSVIQEIAERSGNTLLLAGAAMLVAASLGIALGCLGGYRSGGLVDGVITIFTLASISTPVFVVGLLLIFLFALGLGLLPAGGAGDWRALLLPTATLAFRHVGSLIRVTRASILDELPALYTRTARSKGLQERVVLGRHVLRNALLPVLAVLGVEFGAMLTGAVVTENVFAWPGIGQLMIIAVRARDFPLLQALVIYFGVLYVSVNLATDLLCLSIDPRLRRK